MMLVNDCRGNWLVLILMIDGKVRYHNTGLGNDEKGSQNELLQT